MILFTKKEIEEFEKFALDLKERVSGYAQEQNSDRYNRLYRKMKKTAAERV